MRARPCFGPWIVALAIGAPPLAAQEVEIPEGYISGWHIVRQGDTLIDITRAYLGSRDPWRLNWRLNPQIVDPDVLQPGERIRVLLAPEESVPAARLMSISGRVEEKPSPLPWESAQTEDLLIEKDGLRTEASSSTAMRFHDGTDLVVNEDSLIFLRRSGRRLTGVEPKAVEIVVGQAEIAARGAEGVPVDLEILVGGARSVPKTGGDGLAQTRARAASEGGAAFMVYEGEGEVEAGGQTVELPRGTGSAVPAGKPPSPPEKLLPAPAVREPAPGSEWQFPDPLVAWAAVPGAASYTVEICLDPPCAQLAQRAVGITELEWRLEPLPVGRWYGRVTAVSPSGLDGYPSPGAPFEVLDDRLDTEPPTGGLEVSGPTAEVGGRVFHDGSARVGASVTDAQSGVGRWTATVNGEAVEPGALDGPWASGEHRVAASAVDRRGNRGAIGSVGFTVDADPPELVWQGEWVQAMLRRVRPAVATERWLRRKRRWAAWAIKEFSRTPRGPGFLVLARGHAGEPLPASYLERPFERNAARAVRSLEIVGDRPEALVLASGVRTPDGERLDDGRYLWLRARDHECGVVRRMAVRTEPAAAGGWALVIEVEDPLGNVQRVEWPFEL